MSQKTDPRGILARFGHKFFNDAAINLNDTELKVSFYEVYMEQIRDLTRDLPQHLQKKTKNDGTLSPIKYENEDLVLIDKGNRCFVKGLNEVIVASPEEMIEIYDSGVTN